MKKNRIKYITLYGSLVGVIAAIWYIPFETKDMPPSEKQTKEDIATHSTIKEEFISKNELPKIEPAKLSKDAKPKELEHLISSSNSITSHLSETENTDKNTYTLALEEVYNDYTRDISGINRDLIESGQMFVNDFSAFKHLPIGSSVTIEINGFKWEGEVTKNKPSAKIPRNSFMKVKLGTQGQYMSAYFNGSSTKGKIYTPDGSYIYEHNGSAGFILSLYEYKKINNALQID